MPSVSVRGIKLLPRISVSVRGIELLLRIYQVSFRFVLNGLYNIVCTTWFVQHGLYNLVCTTWFVQHCLYNLVCTTWFVQHGFYKMVCTTWIAQRGLFNMVCTTWLVHHGLYNMVCTTYGFYNLIHASNVARAMDHAAVRARAGGASCVASSGVCWLRSRLETHALSQAFPQPL